MAELTVGADVVTYGHCKSDCPCLCHETSAGPTGDIAEYLGHAGNPCPGKTTHRVTFVLDGRHVDTIYEPRAA